LLELLRPSPATVHGLGVRFRSVIERRPTPEKVSFALPFRPLVESWDRADAPSQVRLRAYREAIADFAAPALASLNPPLGLAFHVAGRSDIAAGCDLDNFLTPVVKALGGGSQFSLISATRGRPKEQATITLLSARSAPQADIRAKPARAAVRLSGSPERIEWKQAIATAIGTHRSARKRGPIELALTFGVSPQRNWVALWKPAIDALGGILGEGSRPWHPRDDRISRLVLRREERDIGWDVELEIQWQDA